MSDEQQGGTSTTTISPPLHLQTQSFKHYQFASQQRCRTSIGLQLRFPIVQLPPHLLLTTLSESLALGPIPPASLFLAIPF
jgi:hypothetical protein